MEEPFLGQISMFIGDFAPKGWALCNGQIMQISENNALFSLIGTRYGGDGRVTFALPDFRGRVNIHPGNGPGLSNYTLGQRGGSEVNVLTTNQLPSHTHEVSLGVNEEANSDDPNGHFIAANGTPSYSNTTNGKLAASQSGSTGGNAPINNVQPYVCANYIIAVVGTYPSRN